MDFVFFLRSCHAPSSGPNPISEGDPTSLMWKTAAVPSSTAEGLQLIKICRRSKRGAVWVTRAIVASENSDSPALPYQQIWLTSLLLALACVPHQWHYSAISHDSVAQKSYTHVLSVHWQYQLHSVLNRTRCMHVRTYVFIYVFIYLKCYQFWETQKGMSWDPLSIRRWAIVVPVQGVCSEDCFLLCPFSSSLTVLL